MLELNWIIAQIEAQSDAAPERLAVVDDGKSLTYGELCSRVNRLCLWMNARSYPARPVAMCMPRSIDQIVIALAAMKAGLGFVSVDGYNINERTAVALQSSGADILFLTATTAHATLLALGDQREAVPDVFSNELFVITITMEEPPVLPLSSQHAYTLFTSGSTSVPKGVRMGMLAIEELIRWQLGQPRFQHQAQSAYASSPGFDVSVQEITSALCSGSTLHIVSQEVKTDPVQFARFLNERGINRLFLTTTLLQMLCLELAGQELPASLTHLVVAGEILVISEAVRNAVGARRNVVIENQYGPTETHVVTSSFLSGDPEKWPDRPTIGWPLPHVKTRVLDGESRECAPGETGELHIGGSCVAIGYIDPERSARQFYTRSEDGTRYYRTGDLVHIDFAGEIHYHGRADDQVKIRGHRVELSEIENILQLCPPIKDVKIGVVTQNAQGRIVALVVTASGDERISTSEPLYERYLADKLPEYMHPEVWVHVQEISVNANGKRTFDASLIPDRLPRRLASAFVSPSNPLEQRVADIWCDILLIEQAGRTDNFFDLGGNSLALTKVLYKLRQEFSVVIPVGRFVESPTIESTARLLQELSSEKEKPPQSSQRRIVDRRRFIRS